MLLIALWYYRYWFLRTLILALLTVAFSTWCLLSTRTACFYILSRIIHNIFPIGSPIPPRELSWPSVINILIFYFTYKTSLRYAKDVFFDYAIPRLRYGFHATDIVFRKPTGVARVWTVPRTGVVRGANQRQFNDSLHRVIDPEFLGSNMGDFAGVDFWDLDYRLATSARNMALSGRVDESVWRTSVWMKQGGEWQVWEVWSEREVAET